jgi:hypothetical protein
MDAPIIAIILNLDNGNYLGLTLWNLPRGIGVGFLKGIKQDGQFRYRASPKELDLVAYAIHATP